MASIKVQEHPITEISIQPEIEGYKELKWENRLPKKIKKISSTALVDTGAQMVVMGIEDVHKMGLRKSNLIPVKLKIKAANSGGMRLLGGVLVRIEGKSPSGANRTTRQIAYVA